MSLSWGGGDAKPFARPIRLSASQAQISTNVAVNMAFIVVYRFEHSSYELK
jgi:hypothetical protein